jgi:hypothetical protein
LLYSHSIAVYNYVSPRFEAQSKITTFWDTTPCSPFKVNRCSSEASVDFQHTTRCYNPEDGTLHNHHCENLKSYTNLSHSWGRIIHKPENTNSGFQWWAQKQWQNLLYYLDIILLFLSWLCIIQWTWKPLLYLCILTTRPSQHSRDYEQWAKSECK